MGNITTYSWSEIDERKVKERGCRGINNKNAECAAFSPSCWIKS